MEKPFLVAIAFILIIILLTSSCSNNDLKNSQKIINASDLAYYVRNLASDEFMGRKPFTTGEKITVDFMSAELKK